MWDLPFTVNIDGEEFQIENNCDYRVILDCLEVYEDNELDLESQHLSALMIFYKEPKKIKNTEKALLEMLRIIDGENDETSIPENNSNKAPERLMSWKKDFKFIAPAVSRVLGYDVRTPNKFTHWWTFMGAYQEIGESVWTTFISIRKKKLHGEKLEKWEERLYRENIGDISLPQNLTEEEKEWLSSDW